MFPNISQLLEPLIPHFVSTKDVAVRSVSAICERLDEIKDAVENPDVTQSVTNFPLSLAAAGVTTFRVPVGEHWELGAITGRALTATSEIVARDVTGVFLFGTSLGTVASINGGSGVRVPSGTEVVITSTTAVEGRIQFNTFHPNAKTEGRFGGLFEREIDYEYSWSQEGMAERHFQGVALPHSTDNHKSSDPLVPAAVNPSD